MKKLLYILLFVPFALFGQDVQIGDEIGGGIVFFIDDSGESGLVVSPVDMGANNEFPYYKYGCRNVEIEGAEGYSVGSGYQNTLDI